MDILVAYESMKDDVEAVTDWSKQIYETRFSEYFKDQKTLYNKMGDNLHKITDDELECILTSIPLQLFTVAEHLSQLKLEQEVVKLKMKEKEHEIIASYENMSESKKKEAASIELISDKLLILVISSVIARVDHEMSFSRELIMGAKKIWDSRKKDTLPVGEVIPDGECAATSEGESLPEYSSVNKQTYIR